MSVSPILVSDCYSLPSGSVFDPVERRLRSWYVWEPSPEYCLLIELLEESGRTRHLKMTARRTTGEGLTERVFRAQMEADPATFGSLRWWWRCPYCSSRVRALYVRPDRTVPLCRHCWCIKYPRQNKQAA